jgi:FtsH-binding integral membrane protein
MNKKIMMIGIAVIVVTCGYLFYENEKIKQEERDFERNSLHSARECE